MSIRINSDSFELAALISAMWCVYSTVTSSIALFNVLLFSITTLLFTFTPHSLYTFIQNGYWLVERLVMSDGLVSWYGGWKAEASLIYVFLSCDGGFDFKDGGWFLLSWVCFLSIRKVQQYNKTGVETSHNRLKQKTLTSRNKLYMRNTFTTKFHHKKKKEKKTSHEILKTHQNQ